MFELRCMTATAGAISLITALYRLYNLTLLLAMLASAGSLSTMLLPTAIILISKAITDVALLMLGCKLINLSNAPAEEMPANTIALFQTYLPAYLITCGISMLGFSVANLLYHDEVAYIYTALLIPLYTSMGCFLYQFGNQHLGQPQEEPANPNAEQAIDAPEDIQPFITGLGFH